MLSEKLYFSGYRVFLFRAVCRTTAVLACREKTGFSWFRPNVVRKVQICFTLGARRGRKRPHHLCSPHWLLFSHVYFVWVFKSLVIFMVKPKVLQFTIWTASLFLIHTLLCRLVEKKTTDQNFDELLKRWSDSQDHSPLRDWVCMRREWMFGMIGLWLQ